MKFPNTCSPFKLLASRNLTKIQIYKIQNTNIQNTSCWQIFKCLPQLCVSCVPERSTLFPPRRVRVRVCAMVPIPHSAFRTRLYFGAFFWSVYEHMSNPQCIFVCVYAYTCVCILWSQSPILLFALFCILECFCTCVYMYMWAIPSVFLYMCMRIHVFVFYGHHGPSCFVRPWVGKH